MPIHALTGGTAAKLRSAQVVTDSVSVVKELIDNALDARADNIIVLVSENLLDTIKVTDNGTGIAPEDRTHVGKRSHTSKIRSLEDLDSLGGHSLGFRGEALASIAQLGKGLSVTTRTRGEQVGVRLAIDCAGKVIKQEKVASGVGTIVLVQGIFSSIPVRRNTALQEARKHCSSLKDMIRAYALARPAIRLQLKVVGPKEKDLGLDYTPPKSGTPSLATAASALFGRTLEVSCSSLDWRERDDSETPVAQSLTLSAFVPDAYQSINGRLLQTSYGQYISIDSRPVSAKRGIGKDVAKIFKRCSSRMTKLPSGSSSPFLALNITCPAKSYDVNVEPAKDDVAFFDIAKLLRFVEAAFSHFYGSPAASIEASHGRHQSKQNDDIAEENCEAPAITDRASRLVANGLGNLREQSQMNHLAGSRSLVHDEPATRAVERTTGSHPDGDDSSGEVQPKLNKLTTEGLEPGERLPPMITNPWTLAQLQKSARPRQPIPESSDPLDSAPVLEEATRMPNTPISHSKPPRPVLDSFTDVGHDENRRPPGLTRPFRSPLSEVPANPVNDISPSTYDLPASPPQQRRLFGRPQIGAPAESDDDNQVNTETQAPHILLERPLPQPRNPPRQRQLNFAPVLRREPPAESGRNGPLDQWLASQEQPMTSPNVAKNDSSPGITLADIPELRQTQAQRRQHSAAAPFRPVKPGNDPEMRQRASRRQKNAPQQPIMTFYAPSMPPSDQTPRGSGILGGLDEKVETARSAIGLAFAPAYLPDREQGSGHTARAMPLARHRSNTLSWSAEDGLAFDETLSCHRLILQSV